MAKPIRVLIADDSVRSRDGLRALLASWPAEVVKVVGEAVNGKEAVQRVEECHPDVVLMDLQMPIMDGLQATRIIKNRWPDITIAVLTIYAAQQDVAIAAGADAFVIKGDTPERLLAAIGVDSAVDEPKHA